VSPLARSTLLAVDLMVLDLERDGLQMPRSEYRSRLWLLGVEGLTIALLRSGFSDIHIGCRGECDTFEQILITSICSPGLLLKGTHEPVARSNVFLDLRIVDLEEDALLARHGILDFGDLVPRAANLDKLLLGRCCPRSGLPCEKLSLVQRSILGIPSRSPCKIRLMLSFRADRTYTIKGKRGKYMEKGRRRWTYLCMGEIAAFVVVQCQAQAALEATEAVSEDVRVLLTIAGQRKQPRGVERCA
jgi:hypothetical protein